jgi:hypothetical protein
LLFPGRAAIQLPLEAGSDIVKKAILAATAMAAFVMGAPSAQADTFKYNFCPGDDSCTVDLTEASLIFQAVDGTADVNDYTLTIRFVGTSTDLFIDTIDFSTGLEFAGLPSLTSAPDGTLLSDWTTKYDKVNAAAGNNCTGDMSNHRFVCSKATTGNGPSFAGTNDWVFSVDFLGTDTLGEDSPVDLRALFVNGRGGKAGLLATDQNYTFDTTGSNDTTGPNDTTGVNDTTGHSETTGSVPEPATLTLFGAGLALGARRLRRRG